MNFSNFAVIVENWQHFGVDEDSDTIRNLCGAIACNYDVHILSTNTKFGTNESSESDHAFMDGVFTIHPIHGKNRPSWLKREVLLSQLSNAASQHDLDIQSLNVYEAFKHRADLCATFSPESIQSVLDKIGASRILVIGGHNYPVIESIRKRNSRDLIYLVPQYSSLIKKAGLENSSLCVDSILLSDYVIVLSDEEKEWVENILAASENTDRPKVVSLICPVSFNPIAASAKPLRLPAANYILIFSDQSLDDPISPHLLAGGISLLGNGLPSVVVSGNSVINYSGKTTWPGDEITSSVARWRLISHASLVVDLQKYSWTGRATMEAMKASKAVVGLSPSVQASIINQANGGLWGQNLEEIVKACQFIISDSKKAHIFGQQGANWVEKLPDLTDEAGLLSSLVKITLP
ncbi:MAG: hypothetical protein HKL80_10620 [Acidimicrobiales bacterium]|nr:hypothetical protein [Acidimicrobiales bacterium]